MELQHGPLLGGLFLTVGSTDRGRALTRHGLNRAATLAAFAEAGQCSNVSWGTHPYLYAMRRAGSAVVLGYGIGSMHLPPQAVGLPFDVHTMMVGGPVGQSLNGSNMVYSELDMSNETTVSELKACLHSNSAVSEHSNGTLGSVTNGTQRTQLQSMAQRVVALFAQRGTDPVP